MRNVVVNRALIYGLSAVLCAVPFAALAKDAKPVAAFKAPRNAFGQPDLSGYWSNATLTPTTRPVQFGAQTNYTEAQVKIIESGASDAEAAGNAKTDLSKDKGGASEDVGGYNRGWLDPGSHVMRIGGAPKNSLLTTPDGQYPLRKGQAPRPVSTAPLSNKQDAQTLTGGGSIATGAGSGQGNVAAQRAAALRGAFDNPEARSLGERCIASFGRNGPPPMFANGFYNNNYEFVQSRDAVAINIEMVHDTRIVRLNSTHRTDGVRPWFGDSIGRYEGDTLVVETTNLPRAQAYMGSWENLKVTERFSRVAKDRVLYQFTVDDPTVWEKPWGGEYEFGVLNGRIMEYACHEGNYALEGILAGAREEEKKLASETKPLAVK
jgi:hypothetical protein